MAGAQNYVPPARVLAPPALACLNNCADLVQFTAEKMKEWLDNEWIVGASVAVVKDGAVLHLGGYGQADVDANLAVDPRSTRFLVGSLSKAVTWVSLLQLVEHGRVSLDEDVLNYAVDVPLP